MVSCVGVAEVAALNSTDFQHQTASSSTGTQQAIEPTSARPVPHMPGSAPAASSAYSTIATTGPVEQATAGTAAPDYFQTVSLAQHQAEAEAGNFSGIPSAPSIEPAEVVFSVPECGLVPKGPPRAAPVRRASTSPAAHDVPGNYTRQREADQPAEHWDSERGEFMPATGPPSARTLRIALESITPYRPATGQKVEA